MSGDGGGGWGVEPLARFPTPSVFYISASSGADQVPPVPVSGKKYIFTIKMHTGWAKKVRLMINIYIAITLSTASQLS